MHRETQTRDTFIHGDYFNYTSRSHDQAETPPLLFLFLFLSPLLAYAVTVCGGNSRGVTTSNVRVDVYAVATVYRNPIEARLL